ncbi:MAG: DUF1829 domain-containing protein [Bryobacteraceae bacterium]
MTSGFDHFFHSVIPKSPRKQPERIVQAINRPARESAETFIYAGNDTRSARSSEPKAYAVLNDADQSISGDAPDAFRNYEIHPVPWSRREVATELAA